MPEYYIKTKSYELFPNKQMKAVLIAIAIIGDSAGMKPWLCGMTNTILGS